MQNNEQQPSENHIFLFILFWAYVLLPLAWGVFQTFKKSLALFH